MNILFVLTGLGGIIPSLHPQQQIQADAECHFQAQSHFSGERRLPVHAALPTVVHGFAVAPGRGSEPATFGLMQVAAADRAPSPWWWYGSCNTQYASVVSDEHLLRCHTSLVVLLDEAVRLGFAVVVRDETGFWESRDPNQLVEAVEQMNRIVARFAGTLTDAMRDAGGDSRQVQGEILKHSDFKRLETE